MLQRLNRYVKNGGHVVYTFKSGFSDEIVKVRATKQPGIINEACGIYYNQFTIPQNVSLKDDPFKAGKQNTVNTWMELITPTTAKVLAWYDHPVWGKYAAITSNHYGKGTATYIGCLTTDTIVKKVLEAEVRNAGLYGPDQQIGFPLITKSGLNQNGKMVHYYFNYSATRQAFKYPFRNGKELIGSGSIATNNQLQLEPWGFEIVEEQ